MSNYRLKTVRKQIVISKLKATCLALLDKVKRMGQPVLVTRKGEPIAQVIPPPPQERPQSWLGSFQSSGTIVGDTIAPATDESEWGVLDS